MKRVCGTVRLLARWTPLNELHASGGVGGAEFAGLRVDGLRTSLEA